jgi:hypothetical protein
MTRINRVALKSVLIAALSLVHGLASAQFVGDVFFVTPAVTIGQGSTGAMELAMFAGDAPFGAARAEVKYDASALEIVSVTPLENGGFTPSLEWKNSRGILKLVAVNGSSLSQPIGTIRLAKIEFRALASFGNRVQITTSINGALKTNRDPIRTGTGFNGEVTIINPIQTKSVQQSLAREGSAASITSAMYERALAMRPAGHSVVLHVIEANGNVLETVVRTVSPSATRD